ncbi:hypothetical protein [Halobacillus salinus]|uniref:Lipoprotein n=1 Tax=Halobacillus salinus TaxID=192814 RepID=A0A4Z0H0U3_9BACI|nr:hypothetical protein [Halobacillus salinus]TGB03484.1 hypothetical protein E4663_00305 [Halobacillus salinus]
MKIKWVIGLALFLLTLAACSSEDILIFQDKSENWSVEYEAKPNGENAESTNLRIAYIGEGDPPETIDYEYDTGSGSGGGTNASLDDGVMEGGEDSCSGCSTTSKGDEITVTVEWDGKKEELTLEPRNGS